MKDAKIINVLLFQVVSLLVSLHKKDRVRGIYKPMRTKNIFLILKQELLWKFQLS